MGVKLVRMFTSTIPATRKQLATYKAMLSGIGGPLAQQGLASIRAKEFHCLGGSVYSLLAPAQHRQAVLRFIVAFQTISDYLDNLCDRLGVASEPAFRQLHRAMEDALEPEGDFADYYRFFPWQEDGGYLPALVRDCRQALGCLPLSCQVRDRARALTGLYIDLQSYKHLETREGEKRLAELYSQYRHIYPDLYWWEFAAACGSTLGIFALVAAPGQAEAIAKAYMPWINGFHILLDYFIDQEEDRCHGDLNLVAYSGQQQMERLSYFYRQARGAAQTMPGPGFHLLVVDGLAAMYLSDAKAEAVERKGDSKLILSACAPRARVLAGLGRLLRKGGYL